MAATAAVFEGASRLLGGRRVIGHEVRSMGDATELVRRGIPFAALDAVLKELGLGRETVAEAQRIPSRTLARRRGLRLAPAESERVLRLARVASRAAQVFGTNDAARRWLQKPSRALGGARPLALLDADVGAEAVLDELGRIEHGIFA